MNAISKLATPLGNAHVEKAIRNIVKEAVTLVDLKPAAFPADIKAIQIFQEQFHKALGIVFSSGDKQKFLQRDGTCVVADISLLLWYVFLLASAPSFMEQ